MWEKKGKNNGKEGGEVMTNLIVILQYNFCEMYLNNLIKIKIQKY
jgi:hypothetical protein